MICGGLGNQVRTKRTTKAVLYKPLHHKFRDQCVNLAIVLSMVDCRHLHILLWSHIENIAQLAAECVGWVRPPHCARHNSEDA